MENYLEVGNDKFHWVWLRDNCRCEKCFDSNIEQFLRSPLSSPLDICPQDVAIEEGHVRLVWQDGHQTEYSLDWLKKHSYYRPAETENPIEKRRVWDYDFQLEQCTYSYEQITQDEGALIQCCEDLFRSGIVVVTGVFEETLDFAKKVFAPRIFNTIHGVYSVTQKEADSATKNVSLDLPVRLGMHTDVPYYDPTPFYQFLHSIQFWEAEGGATEFSDGLSAAEDFRHKHPEKFELLSTHKIPHFEWGTNEADRVLVSSHAELIQLNRQGKIVNFCFTDFCLDTITGIPFDKFLPYYEAFQMFYNSLREPKYYRKIKLHHGSFALWDNHRLWHAREGWSDLKGVRHLKGGYFYPSELHGRYNYLVNKQLGQSRL